MADGIEADGPSSEPVISGDGSRVAFTTEATNLDVDCASIPALCDFPSGPDVFAHDLTSGETAIVSDISGTVQGPSSHPSLSADGHTVAVQTAEKSRATWVPSDVIVFADDPADAWPWWAMTRSFGNAHEPSLTADGGEVAFTQRYCSVPGLYWELYGVAVASTGGTAQPVPLRDYGEACAVVKRFV